MWPIACLYDSVFAATNDGSIWKHFSLLRESSMKAATIIYAAGAACILALAPPAIAVPITDVVNPSDTTIAAGSTPTPCPAGFTCTSGALSFVHDITDNGFTLGSTITSATLAIHLTDLGGGSESYRFDVGATQTFSSVNVPGGGSTDTFALTGASLADLALDGKITVVVNGLSGNFEFADSTLTAQVTPGPSVTVPEPGSLALLSVALAAFGTTRRRKKA
jgi:hypothetical protein